MAHNPNPGPTLRKVCLGLQDMTQQDIDYCVNNLYLGAERHNGWWHAGQTNGILLPNQATWIRNHSDTGD